MTTRSLLSNMIIGAIWLVSGARAWNESPVVPAGQTGGVMGLLEVRDHWVYMIAGPRLEVFDTRRRESMPEGESAILGVKIWDIAVSDEWAFLAAGGSGVLSVRIVDHSQPSSVVVNATDQAIQRVATDGQFVYAAAFVTPGEQELRTYQILESGELSLKGRALLGNINHITAIGTLLYVATDVGLVAVDASVPDNLKVVGAYEDIVAKSVVMMGGIVFVAGHRNRKVVAGGGGVTSQDWLIVGLSTEGGAFLSPVLSRRLPNILYSMTAESDRLYLYYQAEQPEPRIEMLRLGQSHDLESMGWYRPPYSEASYLGQKSMVVSDRRIYLAANNVCGTACDEYGGHRSGLIVVGVEEPNKPDPIGAWLHDSPSNPAMIAANGSTVVVGQQFGQQVHIVDMSDPVRLKYRTDIQLDNNVLSVAAAGNLVLVSDFLAVHLFSIDGSHSAIESVSMRDTRAVEMHGSRAFAVGEDLEIPGRKQLVIFDVSHRAGLRRVGQLDVGDQDFFAVDILATDGLVVVASSVRGFVVVDVSNPGAPRILSSVSYRCQGLAMVGQYLLVARGFPVPGSASDSPNSGALGGFGVFDLSRPQQPRKISEYVAALEDDGSGVGRNVGHLGIGVIGLHAVLALQEPRLRVVDIAAVDRPREIQSLVVPDIAMDLGTSGALIAVAAKSAGLLSFRDESVGLTRSQAFLPLIIRPR